MITVSTLLLVLDLLLWREFLVWGEVSLDSASLLVLSIVCLVLAVILT